jgi:hypothetical protein
LVFEFPHLIFNLRLFVFDTLLLIFDPIQLVFPLPFVVEPGDLDVERFNSSFVPPPVSCSLLSLIGSRLMFGPSGLSSREAVGCACQEDLRRPMVG